MDHRDASIQRLSPQTHTSLLHFLHSCMCLYASWAGHGARMIRFFHKVLEQHAAVTTLSIRSDAPAALTLPYVWQALQRDCRGSVTKPIEAHGPLFICVRFGTVVVLGVPKRLAGPDKTSKFLLVQPAR